MTRRRSKLTAKEPETRRCAIYTRKSTTQGLEQEFNSLDAQREACERYIANQVHFGWKLMSRRYDDGGFTGANLDRPAFQRLMQDIKAGKIDIVVVYKVDRLSRSLLDFARVMDRFNQAGVAFVSVTQNFSTADAMGRLTLNMLMSFAEFEREMISERTRDKIAAARRRGKWTGGSVPLGYDVVDKRLVINELEAVVVRELFDLYEQHRSALTVAFLLNALGRTTKRLRTANGRIRASHEWTKKSVLRALCNPIYAGLMPYGEELHEGEHEGIIERDRYTRIQAILDTRNHSTKSPGRNPAYILRGLLRCKLCGNALTPASTRKGNHIYRYYRCTTRDRKGSKACAARPLPAEELEAFVAERIREVTADGALARDVVQHLEACVAAKRRALRTEQRDIPTVLAALISEARALAEKVGTMTGRAGHLLEERLQEVNAELGHQEARLAHVEQALALLDQVEIEAQWVASMLSNFDAVWDTMSLVNRARLMRAVVQRVEVDEPSGIITAILTDLESGLPDASAAEVHA
jgi:site-specific DNA recombinase